MNINGHAISITRTTQDSQGIRVRGQVTNEFPMVWYIKCHKDGWVEKARNQEDAQYRAYQHAEGREPHVR